MQRDRSTHYRTLSRQLSTLTEPHNSILEQKILNLGPKDTWLLDPKVCRLPHENTWRSGYLQKINKLSFGKKNLPLNNMKRVCPEFFIARYGLQKNVKKFLKKIVTSIRYGVRTQPLLCAVSNLKKNIKWVGEKWFKSWCHSERSLYKNLMRSLARQQSSDSPNVFLFWVTKYSRLEVRLSLCWYRLAGG